MPRQIFIHTDGSCPGNQFENSCGGYGAIVTDGKMTIELAQGYLMTTNNRMELRAVIAALRTVTSQSFITIFSDSKYVIDAFNMGWIDSWVSNGWRKSNRKPVENSDLWHELLELIHGHEITWQWIKGHNGNAFNERADTLACMAAAGSNMLDDAGLTTVTVVNQY